MRMKGLRVEAVPCRPAIVAMRGPKQPRDRRRRRGTEKSDRPTRLPYARSRRHRGRGRPGATAGRGRLLPGVRRASLPPPQPSKRLHPRRLSVAACSPAVRAVGWRRQHDGPRAIGAVTSARAVRRSTPPHAGATVAVGAGVVHVHTRRSRRPRPQGAMRIFSPRRSSHEDSRLHDATGRVYPSVRHGKPRRQLMLHRRRLTLPSYSAGRGAPNADNRGRARGPVTGRAHLAGDEVVRTVEESGIIKAT